MNVKILFFGSLADACGTRETLVAVEPNASIADLLEKAAQIYHPLTVQKVLVAVNEEYAHANTILNDSDEVAIFTAVSGG